MIFKDLGEIELKECDDMNIPVNCFISSPEENSDKKWHWSANNYMPRKNYITESSYEIIAESKEDILEAIKTYVIPLYQAAINNLTKNGELYYWQVK